MGRVRNLLSAVGAYSKTIKVNGFFVLSDFLISRLRYGFSIEDYFVISNGYAMSDYQKKKYFTLGRAESIQRKLNNVNEIHYVENKVDFLRHFAKFVKRNWIYPKESTLIEFREFVRKNPIFIVKPINGQCGKGIKKINTIKDNVDIDGLFSSLSIDDMLVEECISPHKEICLGTEGLSTFRVYTLIDKYGKVQILKAKYRAGIGDSITDTSDGCVAYPVSIQYGIIEGPGINEVFNSEYYFIHPNDSKIIVGIKIPYWDELKACLTDACLKVPNLRYLGWDIAITDRGVELIEANHNPYHGTFEIMGTERFWYHRIREII